MVIYALQGARVGVGVMLRQDHLANVVRNDREGGAMLLLLSYTRHTHLCHQGIFGFPAA